MKHKIYLSLFLLVFSLNAFSSEPKISFKTKTVGILPETYYGQANEGVAGAFSGIIGDRLIVAGGANFPDKKPWEGGMRQYHDRMYVFKIEEDTLILESNDNYLPGAVAYGASVALPDGILCIGGNNGETCFSNVFLIEENSAGDFSFRDFPELPVPLSYASAVAIGNDVYVAGGSSSADAIDTGNYFFRLDLSKRNSFDFEWETLPSFPGKGRIYAVAAGQSNGIRTCVYLFSGRNIDSANNEVSIFSDGLVYDPVLRTWSKIDAVDFPVMGGSAFPVGANSIVFLGGSQGDLLLKEQSIRKQFGELVQKRDTAAISKYKEERIKYYTEHPGFSKDILLFNTITQKLITEGTFEYYCPVSTNVIPYKNGAFLTSGEISPGIRTPYIFHIIPQVQAYRFGWLNSSVIFIYFLVLIIIGYVFSKKQKSTDDYFKGGGRIPWWAAGISLFGTALSAITFMAIPAKTYATDWSYFIFNMSIFLVAPVIIILFIPFYRKLNVTTAYEYLEKRFNLTIRLLGSISFILFQIGRMGVILLLPSLALNVVTGMNVFWCIVLMGVISLVYTLMGGIEAVIWTDVIQVFVLLTGAVVAVCLILGSIDGGAEGAFNTALAAHKFNLLDLRLTLREPTVWVMLIAGLFTNITSYGTDQTMVQRYLTTKTEKEARRSVWTNAWLAIPSSLLFFSIGTVLFIFYRSYPDLYNPLLTNTDSIFPWYIASGMPAGLSGLLIAGIFAAAMSSLSSSMNSGATAYSTDIHFRFSFTPGVSHLKIARITTLVIGLAGTVFALFMASWNIHSLWDEFNKIIGLVIGSLGGLFLLGILTRKANAAGALTGIIISMIIQIYISNNHTVYLMLYTATGVISCFIFGWLGSLAFPKYSKNIDGLTVYKTK